MTDKENVLALVEATIFAYNTFERHFFGDKTLWIMFRDSLKTIPYKKNLWNIIKCSCASILHLFRAKLVVDTLRQPILIRYGKCNTLIIFESIKVDFK